MSRKEYVQGWVRAICKTFDNEDLQLGETGRLGNICNCRQGKKYRYVQHGIEAAYWFRLLHRITFESGQMKEGYPAIASYMINCFPPTSAGQNHLLADGAKQMDSVFNELAKRYQMTIGTHGYSAIKMRGLEEDQFAGVYGPTVHTILQLVHDEKLGDPPDDGFIDFSDSLIIEGMANLIEKAGPEEPETFMGCYVVPTMEKPCAKWAGEKEAELDLLVERTKDSVRKFTAILMASFEVPEYTPMTKEVREKMKPDMIHSLLRPAALLAVEASPN